jgi:integrase/recombinase XerD
VSEIVYEIFEVMNNVRTSIELSTRRILADGTYPVKLRITYNRKRVYYNTGHHFTEEDFDRVINYKSSKKDKNIKRSRIQDQEDKENFASLMKIEEKAKEVIAELPVFSFRAFKNKFFDLSDHAELFDAFRYYINELEKNDQINTASMYRTTMHSWEKFYKGKSLPLADITPKMLKDYENYMLGRGRTITTASIAARCIRRLFNFAIKRGDLKRELYPFGDKDSGLYVVRNSQNVKRALAKSDIRKIFEYEPEEDSPEGYYRDIWIFSYLCNGMNMTDICRLRYENIQGDSLVFARHKTLQNRKVVPIIVDISPHIREIIDRWGTKPVSPREYIFDVLTPDCTAADIIAQVRQFTKMVNRYINRVAEKVGIEAKVTTYTARHSFATVLKQSGESVMYISEALGHSNIRTTELYMKSFDSDKRKEAGKKLTDW